jgi:hypothetical protein
MGADASMGERRVRALCVAVRNLQEAVVRYKALGFTVDEMSLRAEWGLETATFHVGDFLLELVSVMDRSKRTAQVVDEWIAKHGEGHYIVSFQVDDVWREYDRLQLEGVRCLPPTPGPAEGPWGECNLLWIHPEDSCGAFVEFVSFAEHGTDCGRDRE